MKPWREIAIPHKDVRESNFQQAEFAADITAVHSGKAPAEYQDAVAFFERTYITEGMRLLLTQVIQRLSGRNGEPVIQLQTAFGGGKTHTMLAVLHLARRECSLDDLPGIPTLVEQAGLMDVPKAKVAVIDGTAVSPGQPWKHGRTTINTLWGELAWQLGGSEGLSMVKEADANGTSPGKQVLRDLLEKYAPCVILMDELVAYIRQFKEGQTLTGGTYGSNVSFLQSLTEAVKQVPNAVVLASLPESEVEAGGERGEAALKALEKTFGRVQALWKPVATEEAFEIVRRRLFEQINDGNARDAVCRAFADAYVAEGAKLPSETQEGRYFDRLCQAYPIHPEVFDRLYEDWSTIDGFQRTRGVLKLMAKVISKLWQDNNQDLLIMPGSLPLFHGDVRNEMTYLLSPGWDAVIERDIDGPRAESTDLESREPRFGQTNAARRVTRTLFLGTAPPANMKNKQATRGLTRDRVLLGCLQPGQTSAVYSDALNRLLDRLHYLNSSGEKTSDSTTFWFDTRANLRREMEDRKRRFDDKTDVHKRIEEVTKRLFNSVQMVDGVHVFVPHGDTPDDSSLRLVVLSPDHAYVKDDPRQAERAVLDYVRNHGSQPRHRSNRLLFIAADQSTLGRLRDSTRVALAWRSIVEDVTDGRLNIDLAQKRQAEKEAKAAEELLPRIVRECFRWLLCPSQDEPTAATPRVEAFPLNTSGGGVGPEIERVCSENELVIDIWAPIHLRSQLKSYYWKSDRPAVAAKTFWEDSLKYLYLPRLRSHDVLKQAISTGVSSADFFGTAYGIEGDKYEGFQLGSGDVSVDDSLLLIEPAVAAEYHAKLTANAAAAVNGGATGMNPPFGTASPGPPTVQEATGPWAGPQPGALSGAGPHGSTAKSFRGAVDVDAALAKSKLNTIADEIIAILTSDPTATVRVTLEIDAQFPEGTSDNTKRAVSENASSLGFKLKDWE
ncbi:MAG: ATP-binding protein [Phycisphaeraceae bacterium]|nr:MAG: ATP-binding protein [Phycisphaeraceae bacterium]